jgi:DNA invertase Pin-like site-specific DNA recombinase
VPDARAIADELEKRGVKLALGASVHDPTDPMGRMFFDILATFTEFEADLIRMRAREHGGRAGEGEAEGQEAEAVRS